MICNLEDYFCAICGAYKEAKIPCCSKALLSRIERGRKRVISGIAEDYFAELLCNTLNDNSLHFFVDQPIKSDKHLVYPDIVIARKKGLSTTPSCIWLTLKWISVSIVTQQGLREKAT